MKIAVFCLPGIGDALMATPLIKLLKNKYPDSIIDIICMFRGVKYIFKDNPDVNSIYELSLYKKNPIEGINQILKLRKKNYDLSILTFPNYRKEYHLAQFILGAKKRIAHKFKSGFYSEFHFLNTDLIPADESVHNCINNLNLLKFFQKDWKRELDKKQIKYVFILDKKDRIYGQKLIKRWGWNKTDIIGIHPGSTVSPAALLRRWPIDRYAKVINFLIGKKKNVIIFVGPDEKDLGKNLYQMVNNKSACKLINDLKFGQAVGILNQINFLICNDNGFGHITNALNIPILTLWASTNDTWTLPYNKKIVTLIRPNNFKPWYRYDLKRSIPSGMKSGMEKISVETITKQIDNILDKKVY